MQHLTSLICSYTIIRKVQNEIMGTLRVYRRIFNNKSSNEVFTALQLLNSEFKIEKIMSKLQIYLQTRQRG